MSYNQTLDMDCIGVGESRGGGGPPAELFGVWRGRCDFNALGGGIFTHGAWGGR